MSGSINDKGLSDREIRFCHEYARSLNATSAARLAGYDSTSQSSAYAQSSRVLKKPAVREYLGEILDLSSSTVLNEIVKIAMANITDAIEWTDNGSRLIPSAELNDRAKAAIKKVKIKKTTRRIFEGENAGEETTIETEVEMYDRHAALQRLASKLGLYPQTVQTLLEGMSAQGLLVPGQAEVIGEGIEDIDRETAIAQTRKCRS